MNLFSDLYGAAQQSVSEKMSNITQYFIDQHTNTPQLVAVKAAAAAGNLNAAQLKAGIRPAGPALATSNSTPVQAARATSESAAVGASSSNNMKYLAIGGIVLVGAVLLMKR